MNQDTTLDGASVLLHIQQISPVYKRKSDAIVFALHICMKQSGFRFVGCGDKNDDSVSELPIPPNWNNNSDSYQFRYKYNTLKSTVLLKFVVLEGQLLVHAMLIEEKSMFHLEIKIDEFVNSDAPLSNYASLYNSLDNLVTIFKLQIIDSLLAGEKQVPKEAPTIRERPADYDPLRIPPTRRPNPVSPLMEPQGFDHPYATPFGIGQNDVFPNIPTGPSGLWGGPGSGNLVGPGHPGFDQRFPAPGRGRGNLPPGHPPGARFDPFGPPGTGNRFGYPDNDDLPPPKGSGYDNMFL